MTATPGIAETTQRIACRAEDAWNAVCFYEHIHRKPSLFLRSVLPVPMRTTGCAGKVGDTSRCLYSDGGYLAKRITEVISGERVEFEVIEHSIRYCRSIALKGGSISVVADDDGACSVHVLTRYELQSRWLRPLRPFIEFTISAMHRIVMRDMQERLEARGANWLCTPDPSA